MPEIERLLETFLVVEDVEAASEFYREVLGLEPYGEASERGALFRLPGGQLLGLVARAAAGTPNDLAGGTVPAVLPGPAPPGGGGAHLAFAVPADAFDAWRNRLADEDVDVLGVVAWERGGRSLYFRDPAGHLLELATPGLWEFY